MNSELLTISNLNIMYHRSTDVSLTLKDPHYPDHDLGIILLSVILTPKEGEPRDVVSLPELLLVPLAHVLRAFSGDRGVTARWNSSPLMVAVSTWVALIHAHFVFSTEISQLINQIRTSCCK